MALLLYFIRIGGTVRLELDYLKIQTDNGYMYGGDQKLFGKLSRHSGCGMIAVCDMILFLQHGEGYRTALRSYTAFVSDIRDNDVYRHRLNLIGVSPGHIIKILKKRTGKNFRFYGKGKLGQDGLRHLIEDSVLQGIPVIVRIGANRNSLSYKINFPASDKNIRTGKMGWHYITVTGLTDSGTVIFSSWGGRGEMLLSDLYSHFGFTGGVIVTDF